MLLRLGLHLMLEVGMHQSEDDVCTVTVASIKAKAGKPLAEGSWCTPDPDLNPAFCPQTLDLRAGITHQRVLVQRAVVGEAQAVKAERGDGRLAQRRDRCAAQQTTQPTLPTRSLCVFCGDSVAIFAKQITGVSSTEVIRSEVNNHSAGMEG